MDDNLRRKILNQVLPTNAFEISLLPNLRPSYATCPKTKQESMSQTQNCSQRVDGKWHSEVLQAKRSTNELGHFSSKALAENYSFTKFYLVLFCFYLQNPPHRDKVYL